jgi:hypothetical protein
MADEPQTEPGQTEQAEANPATEYQPPATVISVYDTDGREHFAAATSKFVVDGLADGTLTEQPPTKTEEVTDGTETGSTGDDPQPGNADGGPGSGDGTPETGSARRGRRAGQA